MTFWPKSLKMPSNANKPVIAVDIDEVLSYFAESFVAFSNKKWGTKLKPDDFDEHWAEIWKVDYAEENRRAHIIRETMEFNKFRPREGADVVLKHLKKRYILVVVSSRHSGLYKETTEWLEKHFDGLFKEIRFAGIWDDLEMSTLHKLKLTKAEVLKEIGADYLIDDHPKHCFAAAEAGITALLFGDYRWNRDVKLKPNMVRAKTWQDVQEYFDSPR